MRRVDRVVVVLKMRRARSQDFTTAMDQPPPLPVGATTRQQLAGIRISRLSTCKDMRPHGLCRSDPNHLRFPASDAVKPN